MRDPLTWLNVGFLLFNSIMATLNHRMATRTREFFEAYLKEKYGENGEHLTAQQQSASV